MIRRVRRARREAAALLLAMTVTAAPLAAATYYVSTGGNDGNAGSLASPWATLQHAADTVGPGDQVWVRGGSYTGFDLETSGTSGLRILFAAYPGELVQITQDGPLQGAGINLEGASYVTVQGF